MKKLIYLCTVLIALTSFHYPFKFETDKAFMIKATQNNLAEVDAAKLALTQSTSDSVKSFAQMMVDEHTNAQAELAALAQKQGVTLPDSTDDEHRMFKQRLVLASGNSFDSAYMQSQVKDHVKTIALFQAEITNGMDAQTKAYAAKLLPKLQMHLQHAQSIASNTGMSNMQQ